MCRDYANANIPYLAEHRRDELVDFVVEKALIAVMRFKPDHPTTSYGQNGGSHFDSWICDVMLHRCTDWHRSKAEGNGDRRYQNDNRVFTAGDLSERGMRAQGSRRKDHSDHDSGSVDRHGLRQPEFLPAAEAQRQVLYEVEVDAELDFEKLISESRLTTWKQAADSVGMELQEYLVVTMDRASRRTLRTAA